MVKELEDLLDDDEDMADLYLERREKQKQAATDRAAKHAARQGSGNGSEEEDEEEDKFGAFPGPSDDLTHEPFHFEHSDDQPSGRQGPMSDTPFAARKSVLTKMCSHEAPEIYVCCMRQCQELARVYLGWAVLNSA